MIRPRLRGLYVRQATVLAALNPLLRALGLLAWLAGWLIKWASIVFLLGLLGASVGDVTGWW